MGAIEAADEEAAVEVGGVMVKRATTKNHDWLESPAAQSSGVQFDRLLHVRIAVDNFGKALARGENVVDEINALFDLVTGREEQTHQRRALLVGVAMVARHSDDRWRQVLGNGISDGVTDQQLAELVCGYLRGPPNQLEHVAALLSRHPVETALAVRLWRGGRGRRKKGQPKGSKWAACSTVISLAGLGIVDEKAVEQMWTKHGAKIAMDVG